MYFIDPKSDFTPRDAKNAGKILKRESGDVSTDSFLNRGTVPCFIRYEP